MTTENVETKSRPGSALIGIGLVVALIGIGTAIYVSSSDGEPKIWLALIGLLIAGIGYARRLLAAVERK